MRTVEKVIYHWNRSEKYECPECGELLQYPNYKCEKCNIRIILKMWLH